MKKIRYLHIEFDEEIEGYEIPAFRGGIIQKAGRENILFHNHLSGHKLLYSYPLIQYKTFRKRPVIICIDDAVDEIHKFFESKDWSLSISGRPLDMNILNLRMKQFNLQIWNHLFHYYIRNWLALNSKNYEEYKELEDDSDRIEFLEKVLKGNILSFAKGVKWNIDKPIECKITRFQRPGKTTFKGNTLMAFSVEFCTNVFIPDFIGLGKGASHGFGTILQLRKNNN
jgi:hypothetical protein